MFSRQQTRSANRVTELILQMDHSVGAGHVRFLFGAMRAMIVGTPKKTAA